MLARRTFLTTIAAAPLAKFCKTEPVRPYTRTNFLKAGFASSAAALSLTREYDFGLHNTRYYDEVKRRAGKLHWTAERRVENKADVERRYALPQGTLG